MGNIDVVYFESQFTSNNQKFTVIKSDTLGNKV